MEKTYTRLEKALRFVGLTVHEVKWFDELALRDTWAPWEVALVRSFVLDTIKELGPSIWRIRICYILGRRRPTQLCEQLKISKPTLRSWVKGTSPNVRHQRMIEQYLLDWPSPSKLKRWGLTKIDYLPDQWYAGQRPWLREDGTYRWCYAKDVPMDATRRLMPYELKGRKQS